MKKILVSLMIVATVVGTVGYGLTQAYFTDTETAANNTFTTGTIDIAVEDQNPWSQSYTLSDMKPGYVDYINFTVANVGSNPANIWKDINFGACVNDPVSEPEADAEAITGVTCDLQDVIDYGLTVKVYDTPGHLAWEQILYKEDITLAAAYTADNKLFLGMLPAGWTMEVAQSYRMQTTAGNEYQGDSITFDIVLDAEQLTGTAVLEDKTTDWQVRSTTPPQGTLTYGVKDSQFIYSFTGVAPLASTNYSLIAYYEPFSSPSASGWPRTVEVLGTTSSDGSGNVSIPSTSLSLAHNLLNMKIWLVPSSNLTGNTMSTFTHSAILFDTGLVDYYDSDL